MLRWAKYVERTTVFVEFAFVVKVVERLPPPPPSRALVYISRSQCSVQLTNQAPPRPHILLHRRHNTRTQPKSRRTTNPRVIVMSSSGTSSDPYVSPLWDTWGPEERIMLNCVRDM